MDKNTLFSSFGKWVAPINVLNFQQKVEELQQREALREIADDALDKDFQKELGFTSISASQLSRKNNRVDPSILEDEQVQMG